MSDKCDYGFTAGTCFGILLTGKPYDSNEKLGWGDSSNSPKEPEIMKALLLAITGTACSPSNPQVTKFLKCENNGGNAIPLCRKEAAEAYDVMIKSAPKDTLDNMQRFTAEYIAFDAAREENLIKAYLELIEEDTCDDSTEFFVLGNGKSITKAELRCRDGFLLEAFLVGIFNFVMNERRKNSKGQELFMTLFEKVPGKDGWTYKGNLAQKIDRKISINRYDPDKDYQSQVSDLLPEEDIAEDDGHNNTDTKTENERVGADVTIENHYEQKIVHIENHYGNETTINIEHLNELKL